MANKEIEVEISNGARKARVGSKVYKVTLTLKADDVTIVRSRVWRALTPKEAVQKVTTEARNWDFTIVGNAKVTEIG